MLPAAKRQRQDDGLVSAHAPAYGHPRHMNYAPVHPACLVQPQWSLGPPPMMHAPPMAHGLPDAAFVPPQPPQQPVHPAAQHATDLWIAKIGSLDVSVVRELLLWGTTYDRPLCEAVGLEYGRHCEEERVRQQREATRVISFDYLSKSAWHALNTKYASSSGSEEYESSWDAKQEVTDAIEAIREQVKPESSFGTKKNALETLRKIGKSICLAPDTLGHEVVKQFQSDDCLEDAMKEILQTMTAEERIDIAKSTDAKGQFMDKMDELVGLADGYCIFEALTEIVRMLEGGAEDSESGSGGDESEAEDGDAHDD